MRRILLAMRPLVLAAFASLLASPAAAQSLETKQAFAAAVIEFLENVPGLFGDEGDRLRASVEGMESGLGRWDAAVRSYSTSTMGQLHGAQPPVEAAMRVALGAVHLERGRVEDAVHEFDEASRHAPGRGDIHLFRALAYRAAGRMSAAADAERRSWTLDPDDPIKAYLLLGHARAAATATERDMALRRLAAAADERAREPAAGRLMPFIRVSLLEETPDRDLVFPPVRYAGAFAALAAGRYENAIVQFRSAIAADPLIADRARQSDAFREGAAALRDGDLPRAIRALVTAVQSTPESSEAHRILATAFWFDEQHSKAAEHLRAAIRLNPDDERARIALADVLGDTRDFELVERLLRETLDAMPASGAAHWRLGRLDQVLHRDVDARREFERALAPGPVSGAGRLLAAITRWHARELNGDAASEACRRWVDLAPNDPAAHRELGIALRTINRDEEALIEFLIAAVLDPLDAAAHVNIGQIHLAAERYEEAASALQHAVDVQPNHAEARYGLAAAPLRAGHQADGARQMEVARRLQADAMAESRRAYEVNLLKIEAALRTEEARDAEAAALWQQVVDREPDLVSNSVSLAEALARAGRHEQAAAAFARAITQTDEPELHRRLAQEYAQIGRPDESAREQATYEQMRKERLRRLGGIR
jgi:tetratricopeptide (TPR) repeat protein